MSEHLHTLFYDTVLYLIYPVVAPIITQLIIWGIEKIRKHNSLYPKMHCTIIPKKAMGPNKRRIDQYDSVFEVKMKEDEFPVDDIPRNQKIVFQKVSFPEIKELSKSNELVLLEFEILEGHSLKLIRWETSENQLFEFDVKVIPQILDLKNNFAFICKREIRPNAIHARQGKKYLHYIVKEEKGVIKSKLKRI